MLLLLLSLPSGAQVSKGFSLYKKGQWDAAAQAFRADIQHPQASPLALFGMAMVSMDSAYAGFQLDSAFAFVEACSMAYRKLSATQKEKLGKKLNPQRISELKRTITSAAFREATRTHTLAGYQHFLSTYAKAPAHTRRMATKNCHELAIRLAGECRSFDEAYQTLSPFYESIKTATPELTYEADTLLYHAYTRQYGWHSYPNFIQQFPGNLCRSDSLLFVQFQQSLLTKDNSTLHQLIRQHPASCLTGYALDSLAKRLLVQGTDAEYQLFTSSFPRHPAGPQIWQLRYQQLRARTANPAELTQFLKSNPDYPFPQQVKADIATLLQFQDKAAFEQFSLKPSGKAGFAFLEKFPESDLIPGMRILFKDFLLSPEAAKADIQQALRMNLFPEYRQELLLEHYKRSSALLLLPEIEAFEQAYPDFSAKSRIAADKQRAAQQPPIARVPLATVVNTPLDEYSPVLSADGKNLFFCRTPGRNQTGVPFNEDVFLSTRNAAGQWSEPTPVAAWNTNRHEAPESISADGNEMYLFIAGNFSKSTKTDTGWTKPIQLPSPLNTFYWQADLKISADGKSLVFAAKDASGNVDIYVSLLQDNGQWGEPFSLGDGINTAGQDRSPFLHSDGTTLYFCSDGRADNIGRLDIYMTRRLDDSWTRWADPIPLGPDINTRGDDWGFRVSTDGTFAYLSVSTEGHHDIVRINLPPGMRPSAVATVSGMVTEMADGPLDAEILWEDLQTGQTMQTTRSNPLSGNFFAILPERKQYAFTVRKAGYFPQSGTIDLRQQLGQITLPQAIRLASLDEMKQAEITLPLNNLFFETAEYTIKTASYPELDRLADLIIREKLIIEVQGHTDNAGLDKANLLLSENRAQAVKEYLISRGCPEAHISARGYGKDRPRANNNTDEGRAINRRVEIKIR